MLLFVLSLFFSAAFGLDCDFKPFFQCVHDKAHSANGTDRQDKWQQCLQSSGCSSTLDADKQASRDKVHECRKKIREDLRAEILACVQTKYPKFDMPKFEKKKGQLGLDNCPSKEAKEKARQCAGKEKGKGWGKGKGGKGKGQGEAGAGSDGESAEGGNALGGERVCQLKKECAPKLSSPECLKQLEEVKAKSCECVKKYDGPNGADPIVQKFQDCDPQLKNPLAGAVIKQRAVPMIQRRIEKACKPSKCAANLIF